MKTLKNNIFMLSCVAKYTPSFFFWTVIEGIVWGCIHSFTSVLFVKSLFDKIEANAPFSDILVLVAIMAAFFILAYIFHEWYWQIIEPSARQTLHQRMQSDLFEKAKTLDLSCYDNPDFYNDFVWATGEADGRAVMVAEDMGKVINRVISTSVIIGILLTVDIWIVLAICFSVLITVLLKLWRTKIQFKRDVELKPLQRKCSYISRVFYLAEYANEIRLSHVDDILNRDFDVTVENIKEKLKRYGKKMFAIGVTRSVSTSMLFDVGILILLIYKMMVEKSITLGDFAASIGATWKLFWQINNLMDYLAKFKEHSVYAEKFRVFLNYSSNIKDSEYAVTFDQQFKELAIKDITFCYPGSDKPIIKNLSMNIKAHQKIALVGYNGAGKSTLIKLLLRLYDPVSGSILLNEKDIKNYTLDSYRGIFGSVFQDYKIYAATLGENVKTDLCDMNEKEMISDSLKRSGFDSVLESLPAGTETMLTKEFDPDGVELSGGEMQKIAISRIFAKSCDIVILDEPSSALDPIAEYELNKVIMSEAFNKTVIFISHRLSATRMADIIYMLENGQIIESGSHEELMKLNGKYAAMFNMQAEKYRTGENCI